MAGTALAALTVVSVLGIPAAYVMQDREFRWNDELEVWHRRRASTLIGLLWMPLMFYSLRLWLRHPRSTVPRGGRIREEPSDEGKA